MENPLLISLGYKPRTGKVVSCLLCGKEKYLRPALLNRKKHFCSLAHANKYQINNGFSYNCVICNKEKRCTPSQYKARNRKTCSIKCRSKLQQDRAEERKNKEPNSQKKEDRCLRYSKKMDDWRKLVFIRDDYTCQICGIRGTYLEAHHIKQFSLHPELRFEISNGQTLCRSCHKKVPHERQTSRRQKR